MQVTNFLEEKVLHTQMESRAWQYAEMKSGN